MSKRWTGAARAKTASWTTGCSLIGQFCIGPAAAGQKGCLRSAACPSSALADCRLASRENGWNLSCWDGVAPAALPMPWRGPVPCECLAALARLDPKLQISREISVECPLMPWRARRRWAVIPQLTSVLALPDVTLQSLGFESVECRAAVFEST